MQSDSGPVIEPEGRSEGKPALFSAPRLNGDYETAAEFIEVTREWVAWGDRMVDCDILSVEEQSRRIRAALADALWWIENRSEAPPWKV